MNQPSNSTSFNPAIPTEMKTVAQVVLNGLQSPKSKRIYKMALRLKCPKIVGQFPDPTHLVQSEVILPMIL